jgi:F-type H+-transporting ATPase subunit gamma
MANPRALVKRRKAVRNIRKITRTMELIATARFKKAMDRASQASAYVSKIAEMVADLSATATDVSHPLLVKHEKISNSLLLVIASNRGLCGGYNAGILREAAAAIRGMRQDGITLHLEVSGKRAITFCKYNGIPYEKSYTQFEDKPRFDEVEPIADRYLKEFIDGKIDRVQVAYSKFFNAAVQKPVVETLLPLDQLTEEKPKAGARPAAEEKKPVEYEFVPSAQDILAQLLPESFKVRLFKCFLDAAVSEQIARRVTMKQATENANEMIKMLSGQYNRARQGRITTEILEVIGGAEALK